MALVSISLYSQKPYPPGNVGISPGATLVSSWISTADYIQMIAVIADADQPGTLYLDFSNDESTILNTNEVTYTAVEQIVAPVTAAYARLRIVNGVNWALSGIATLSGIEATFENMGNAVGTSVTAEIIDKGGQVFNVKAYGAKCDNSTDDTAAWQAAFASVQSAGGGIVFHPGGTSLVSAELTINGDIEICGVGASSIIKLANGSVSTAASFVMLSFGSAGSANSQKWAISDLVIDGNGSGQNFTSFTSSEYFEGVSAPGNQGGSSTGPALAIKNVKFQNFVMGGSSTYLNGTAINTFGISLGQLSALACENCDINVWFTAPYTNTPWRWQLTDFDFHNTQNTGIYIEGTPDTGAPGSALLVEGGSIVNDSLASKGPTGIAVITANQDVTSVIISDIHLENLGYIIDIGEGASYILQNSVIQNLTAINCGGSFHLSQMDGSSIVENLTAIGCAKGVTGNTVFASFEFLAGTISSPLFVSNIRCVSSANQGVLIQGPTTLNGGFISGSINSNLSFASPSIESECTVRNVIGYNPVGSQTVAVPVTGVATTPFPFDSTYYVTANASGTTTVAISGGPTITIPASTCVPVFVPAGQTLTPSYANAPTWEVEGN